MFLQVVANAWDIGSHFHTISQSDSGNFSNSGVWFLGSFGRHLGGYPAFEWRIEKDWAVLDGIETARQSDCLSFASNLFPFALYELIDGGHWR